MHALLNIAILWNDRLTLQYSPFKVSPFHYALLELGTCINFALISFLSTSKTHPQSQSYIGPPSVVLIPL